MAIYKGELQTDSEDKLYPHSMSDVIFRGDGTSVEDFLNAEGNYPANVSIKGRTLINLLGRVGNAIYKKWQANNNTTKPGWKCNVTYSGEDFVLTCTEVATMGMSFSDVNTGLPFNELIKASRYYIILADAQTDANCSSAFLSQMFEGIANQKKNQIGVNSKGTLYCAVNTSRASQTNPSYWYFDCSSVAQKVGGVTKFRNIRVYEISKEIFDKIGTDAQYTDEKLVSKFPYVDDLKCIINPYIESNENLLYGMVYEKGTWGSTSDNMGEYVPNESRLSPYKMIPVEPNQDYTLYYPYTKGFTHSWVAFYKNGKILKHEIVTFSQKKSVTINSQLATHMIFDMSNGNNLVTDEMLANSSMNPPVLVKGSEIKEACDCLSSRIMFDTKLYDGEVISSNDSGQYSHNSEWYDIDLDYNRVALDTFGRGTNTHGVTFTEIEYPTNSALANLPESYFNMVRYDGKIIEHHVGASGWMNKEAFHFGGSGKNTLYMSIPNSLTGWGPNYNPTPDEIRAYFMGWRMFQSNSNNEFVSDLYNGTGVKRWVRLWCGVGDIHAQAYSVPVLNYDGTSVCPTEVNNHGYTPYRVVYKRPVSIQKKDVAYGNLCYNKNVPLVSGSGLVIGEYSLANRYKKETFINAQNNKLKHRAEDFLAIRTDKLESPVFRRYPHIDGGNSEFCIQNGKLEIGGFNPIDFDFYQVDYLIYSADTVTSFDYSVNISESKLKKIMHDISATNQKIMYQNRLLENLDKVACNPSILTNGDFRFWQRGETITTISTFSKYGPDRWRYDLSSGTTGDIRKHPKGGVLFNGLKYWAGLSQVIDLDEMPELRGKTITVSCELHEVADFDVYLRVGAYDTIKRDSHKLVNMCCHKKGCITFNIPIASKYLIVWLNAEFGNAGKSLGVKYIKAELGDKMTPYTPRPYDEELAACQRYYQVHIVRAVKSTDVQTYGQPVSGCDFPVPLRVAPTSKVVDNKYCTVGGTHIPSHPTIQSVFYNTVGGIVQGLELLSFNNTLPNQIVKMTMEFDAEIY